MRHGSDPATAAITTAAKVIGGKRASEPPDIENPEIDWGRQARDGVSVPTTDGRRVHISIEAVGGDRAPTIVRPGMRVFVGVDVDTDIVARTTAEGVRLVTILHGPEAPRTLRFPLTLPDELTLDALPSGGYDIVDKASGARVGRFFAAWAYDFVFRPIPVHYALEDDTTIVMEVGHSGPAYPVVADPSYARR
jgi:hypothetical protein